MRNVCRTLTISLCAALLAVGTLTFADADARSISYDLNIPSEDLTAALQSFAIASHHKLLYKAELTAGKFSRALKGHFTAQEAMESLLSGTGLSYEITGSSVVLIKEAADTGKTGDQEVPVRPMAAPFSQGEGGRVTLLAQANSPTNSTGPSVPQDQSVPPKDSLEEILVTGSRVYRAAPDGAQDVKLYTREQIAQSGQTSVSDFLNSLPDVGVSLGESGDQIYNGATSIKLHGLPIGTTLVLINGHRVEASGAQFASNIFDLNNIPITAIERIEIVPTGSSAIYGSDALAGVVNIQLKKDFDGLGLDSRYGSTSDGAQSDVITDASWGKRWSRGSVSIIGTYQTRSELTANERALTATDDYRAYGGADHRWTFCNPGNVSSVGRGNLPGLTSSQAGIPQSTSGHLTISDFGPTSGMLNQCSSSSFDSLIPDTHRLSFYAAGSFEITPSVELFAEALFSHVEEFINAGFYPIFAKVPASNPFNPFGGSVNVSFLADTQNGLFQNQDAVFVRPLVGIRGALFDKWHWEVSGWESQDREKNTITGLLNTGALNAALANTDPANSVNLFATGAAASPQVLNSLFTSQLTKYLSRTEAAEATARGPALTLPGGPIEVALGGQYAHDTLSTDNGYQAATVYHRAFWAVFGEARVPIVGNGAHPEKGERLALSLAARYDKYDDFGSKTTPQVGVELRPVDSLLLRGTYGKAFVAPSLYQLYSATYTRPTVITDAANGGASEQIQYLGGGNTGLSAETGQSRTLGFVYSSEELPGLRVSATYWGVDLKNSIQAVQVQDIVNNEATFPGSVTRDPATGQITSVDGRYRNFGLIQVKGLDYGIQYQLQTKVGTFSPSAAATETYKYRVALIPGATPTDRVSRAYDDGNFSPRWKGTLALGWSLSNFSASIDGRYVGRYLDYRSDTRVLGNFWNVDANFKYVMGDLPSAQKKWLGAPYVSIGAVNLFDAQPKYSNFNGGNVGYDPAEYDIRGRYLYIQIGSHW
jgi:iron complex outermembrane receptor protein